MLIALEGETWPAALLVLAWWLLKSTVFSGNVRTMFLDELSAIISFYDPNCLSALLNASARLLCCLDL